MGDGRRSHALNGDDFAAIHVPLGGNGLKDHETRFIGQSFRYFLNLRTVHNSLECNEVARFPARKIRFLQDRQRKQATEYLDAHLNDGASKKVRRLEAFKGDTGDYDEKTRRKSGSGN